MDTIELIYNRHNRNAPAAAIAPGVIHYHELTIVLKGTLCYGIDEETADLCAGDAVFVPAESLRRRSAQPEAVDYISFNFRCPQPPRLPTVVRGAVTREVQLLLAAFDEFRTEDFPENAEKPAHLLACLLLSLEDGLRTAGMDPLARQIRGYLHKHFRRRLSLEEIGRTMAFSPVYCDTVFRREFGRSIIDYLIELRIDEAKRLLIEGSLDMGRVAELSGFQDANYFSRVFKKRTGQTPTGYRKRLYGQ